MDRRPIFKTALAGVAGALAGGTAQAETPRAQKVVYHLADSDKASFVLGNLANHLEGAGGPDKISLAVVMHGPALASFRAAGTNRALLQDARERIEAGVTFHGCAPTMAGLKLTPDHRLPGLARAAKGGV